MAGERLREALRAYRKCYMQASRRERTAVLNEFCRLSRYHRKYAIALLRQPADDAVGPPRRRRGPTYSGAAVRVIAAIWTAAGYPWSQRLKALLPLWLPWARGHLPGLTADLERPILAISARQMDRRLAPLKRRLKRRLYGRTKPGVLLKHQIPVHAEPWAVAEAGYAEIDLVSHSGPSAQGEFAYTLNLTDVHTGWCESRAVLGRGEEGVVAALDAIRRALPFPLRAIDSDNGSEFINHHLLGYCRDHQIRFTRGRPYKKNDNARVEQKNWTHVRRLLGWERYDSPQAVRALNDLYGGGLRLMMNLFQPSVKLQQRRRVGARLCRRYEPARTPFDRLRDAYPHRPLPGPLHILAVLRDRTDPFVLARSIQQQLDHLDRWRTAPAAAWPPPVPRASPFSLQGRRAAPSPSLVSAYA
jgi:transposase InsO family protein